MKWNDAKKKMPTETGAYLAYCEKGYFIALYSQNGGRFAAKEVTHWMPLPLPPDEQQEERQARWVRHDPNPEAMETFHKMGIGKAMGVNSIYWTCSRCGGWGTLAQNYCSKCGAKMKAGE